MPKPPTSRRPTAKRPPSKQRPPNAAPAKSPKADANANANAKAGASDGKGRPAPAPGRAPASAGRPGWVVPAVVVAVVVALFTVAVIATRLGGGDGDEGGRGGGEVAQTRSVTVSGAALPELPSTGTDPAIGVTAPTLSGASFDGRPVEIGGTGRPQLVLFVAHWCPHCQREVPLLAPELGRITPPGVEVVTVATGTKASSPNYPPSKWLERESWPSKVLADDGDTPAAKAYGLGGYPYFVLLGRDGKVVSRGSGEKTVAEVEALLQQVA